MMRDRGPRTAVRVPFSRGVPGCRSRFVDQLRPLRPKLRRYAPARVPLARCDPAGMRKRETRRESPIAVQPRREGGIRERRRASPGCPRREPAPRRPGRIRRSRSRRQDVAHRVRLPAALHEAIQEDVLLRHSAVPCRIALREHPGLVHPVGRGRCEADQSGGRRAPARLTQRRAANRETAGRSRRFEFRPRRTVRRLASAETPEPHHEWLRRTRCRPAFGPGLGRSDVPGAHLTAPGDRRPLPRQANSTQERQDEPSHEADEIAGDRPHDAAHSEASDDRERTEPAEHCPRCRWPSRHGAVTVPR